MMRQKMTRRELMALAGGTVVSIGLPGTFIKLMDSENIAMAAELRADGRPRIPPGQHAVKVLTDMGGEIIYFRGSLNMNGMLNNPMKALRIKAARKPMISAIKPTITTTAERAMKDAIINNPLAAAGLFLACS